MNNVSIEQLHR